MNTFYRSILLVIWHLLINSSKLWNERPLTAVILNFAPTHLHASASAAEARKAQKYADLTDRYDFRPFAVETFGAFGPSALELIDALVRRIQAQSTEVGVRSRIYRRLSSAIQAGNARRIIEAHSSAASGRFLPPVIRSYYSVFMLLFYLDSDIFLSIVVLSYFLTLT